MASHWNILFPISFHSFTLSRIYFILESRAHHRAGSSLCIQLVLWLQWNTQNNQAKFFLTSKIYAFHTFSLKCCSLPTPILSLLIFHLSSLLRCPLHISWHHYTLEKFSQAPLSRMLLGVPLKPPRGCGDTGFSHLLSS